MPSPSNRPAAPSEAPTATHAVDPSNRREPTYTFTNEHTGEVLAHLSGFDPAPVISLKPWERILMAQDSASGKLQVQIPNRDVLNDEKAFNTAVKEFLIDKGVKRGSLVEVDLSCLSHAVRSGDVAIIDGFKKQIQMSGGVVLFTNVSEAMIAKLDRLNMREVFLGTKAA